MSFAEASGPGRSRDRAARRVRPDAERQQRATRVHQLRPRPPLARTEQDGRGHAAGAATVR